MEHYEIYFLSNTNVDLTFPNSKLLHFINVHQNTKLPFILTNLDLKLVYELLLNRALDSSESTDGLRLIKIANNKLSFNHAKY